MSFEVTVTPTVYDVEVAVNPSVHPFDVEVTVGNVPDLDLTTNGDSGASTFDPLTGELNIPEYTLDGLGGVPESRTLTINGTTQDLSANRTFSVPTHDAVTIGSPANGLAIDGNQVLTIGLASGSQTGALSSTDWTTFNGKQNALGYTPEDVANKSTDTGLGTSNTLYPSQGAVKSYIDTGLSGKENTLGFTPENVANKAINFTSPDDTKYPTTLAVSTALAGKQDLLTNPITGTGASGQVSFWTGTGTQSGDNGFFWDNSTKNLRINQSIDAGFRLDVNGTARVQGALSVTTGGASITGLSTIQGTTASDSGQLGSELLTTGTGDASWTGSSFATGYTHVAGSTTTLTSTLAGVIGNFYQITYTVTGRTAGSFTIAFGGYTSGNLTSTGAVGPRATTTDTLVITPTSNFNGTIVLSIKVISISSGSVTFISSFGTITNQIRISSSNTNTFFGRDSGTRNTTGILNTFYGTTSGELNTTGSGNSFLGVSAGRYNTIGGSNVFVGLSSGLNNLSGSGNTFLGSNSGSNLANGVTALTVINNSVFIGALSRANADNETNQIVIGHTAIGLGSNTTVIGNSSTTFGRWWGNLLLGTSTDAGYRLDVNGTARIQATADTTPLTISGYSLTGSNTQPALSITGTWDTTGTPTALLVNITDTASNAISLLADFQVGGASRVSLFKSGRVRASNGFAISSDNIGGIFPNLTSPNELIIRSNTSPSTTNVNDIEFSNGQGNIAITSGTRNLIFVSRGANPTSGTGIYNVFRIAPTINQTGGANGITRGLYVNPTLTSAADWRSIEWSNNTGWGLYGGGTANNYLNGKLLVKTNVDAGFDLDVNGTARVQGAITTDAPTGGTAKPFKIGAVATVTPTSPNRTIEIEIDGTTYYLTAKTTND